MYTSIIIYVYIYFICVNAYLYCFIICNFFGSKNQLLILVLVVELVSQSQVFLRVSFSRVSESITGVFKSVLL